jgi:phosphoribosylformimino-5-aminoimidazole carboxamide ribotide isomerase
VPFSPLGRLGPFNPFDFLLPVIDLLDGQVVHAVRGQRQNYRPLRSELCSTADAYDVALAFASKLHSTQVYVADLNAIQSRPVQWEALCAIHRVGLRMWLDAGMTNPLCVQAILQQLSKLEIKDTSIILALETWRNPNELTALVEEFGADRFVFSLDLREGIPLMSNDRWPVEVLAIAQRVHDAGIRRLLLLDLAQVGSSEGPSTLDLCRRIKSNWAHLQLACGGGVRNADDCRALVEAGGDVVLVATALHSGLILT